MNKQKIWNSANIITIIRICLVPVFIVALLSPWPSWIDGSGKLDFIKPWVALVIFIIISITDSIDGYLARSRNQVTDFGKFLDPLADKILVAGALIALVELSVLPTWVVLIILMREFIISGVRMLAASQGVVIAASWYGKAKTVSQIVAICLFIFKEGLSFSGAQELSSPVYIISWIVMIISLILTLVSMFDYLYKARSVIGLGGNPKTLSNKEIAQQVITTAKENNITIGCAESITSGLIAAALTDVAGSSSVFLGGINSYSYDIKSNVLGVDKNILDNIGAINDDVAKQMAKGARIITKCDIAISSTGIAGPDSDEFNNKVGTVYIGLSDSKTTYSKLYNFDGNRLQIRNQTVNSALLMLLKAVQDFNK